MSNEFPKQLTDPQKHQYQPSSSPFLPTSVFGRFSNETPAVSGQVAMNLEEQGKSPSGGQNAPQQDNLANRNVASIDTIVNPTLAPRNIRSELANLLPMDVVRSIESTLKTRANTLAKILASLSNWEGKVGELKSCLANGAFSSSVVQKSLLTLQGIKPTLFLEFKEKTNDLSPLISIFPAFKAILEGLQLDEINAAECKLNEISKNAVEFTETTHAQIKTALNASAYDHIMYPLALIAEWLKQMCDSLSFQFTLTQLKHTEDKQRKSEKAKAARDKQTEAEDQLVTMKQFKELQKQLNRQRHPNPGKKKDGSKSAKAIKKLAQPQKVRSPLSKNRPNQKHPSPLQNQPQPNNPRKEGKGAVIKTPIIRPRFLIDQNGRLTQKDF